MNSTSAALLTLKSSNNMWNRWEGTYTTWMGLLGAFTRRQKRKTCETFIANTGAHIIASLDVNERGSSSRLNVEPQALHRITGQLLYSYAADYGDKRSKDETLLLLNSSIFSLGAAE